METLVTPQRLVADMACDGARFRIPGSPYPRPYHMQRQQSLGSTTENINIEGYSESMKSRN